MGKITIADLQQRKDHLVLGDVCYFATPQYNSADFENDLSLLDNPAVKSMMSEKFKIDFSSAEFLPSAIFLLSTEYWNFRERNREEPSWIQSLNEKLKRFLRQGFLSTDPTIDPFCMFPRLPYSGFGYHILEDGITARVCQAFNLHRLSGVSQLGFLQQPISMSEAGRILTQPFPHNRYIHVLDVRAIGKLILYNNNATEHEHLLYDVASLSHDARTPAGSDSIKGIDFKAFDEDVHYPKVLAKVDFKLLPELSEDDKDRLVQIILNRGILGSVLDIADKLGYISRDTFYLLDAHYSTDEQGREKIELKTMEEAKRVTSLWETVCIEDGKMFFTDTERLIAFLEHRAKMFSGLYQNPYSRFWEQFVKTFVLERFYKTKRITEEQLLNMQDWQLKGYIHQEIGEDILDLLIGSRMEERREGYQTFEQAEARRAELKAQGRVVCIIEKAFPVKAGAHFLVQTKDGLKTLKEADPAAAAHIHNLAQPETPFNLYYVDLPLEKLPPALRNWN